ncbi:GINS complex subunit 2 [Nematocida sp. AWRm77]|nr:GINS complex subunit 2 [Nematocida sp. AWRm77]
MGWNLTRAGDVFGREIAARVKRDREAETLLAQTQKVTVTPLVYLDKAEMIEGTFGPFHPMVPAVVPFYVALFLKYALVCVIHPPEWLSVKYLKNAVEQEKELPDEFGEIEMYLFENAEACLTHCTILEDISEIRILIKELKELRMAKLLKGLEYIDTPIIGTNHLTFFEFRKIKEYILPHLEIEKIKDHPGV